MKSDTTAPDTASPPKDAARAARRVPRSRFGLEITAVLCIKLLLMLLLRAAWFSHPASTGLTDGGVAAALFAPVNGPLPREERTHGSGP
jgi:hypothetical protein